VTIKVDAYPDYDFNGTVTSFSPATGSFSILPPDNATGNFVKTVQRLPVKLLLMPITILKK
jgi:membrane fusion protein (multidrug efflux system)